MQMEDEHHKSSEAAVNEEIAKQKRFLAALATAERLEDEARAELNRLVVVTWSWLMENGETAR